MERNYIEFDNALTLVLSAVDAIQPIEEIDYMHALYRVLACDVVSDADMPAFDKSAMDGYACRMVYIFNDLAVIECIAAGQIPLRKIEAGMCSKIFTGAKLPEGADCVIKVEETETIGADTIRFTATNTKTNIRRRGEDLHSGDVVLTSGTLIKPQHIAILASVGCTKVQVFEKIKVAVLSTGDELVEPDEKVNDAQIRNTNAIQLINQIIECGAIPMYYGIIKDDFERIREKILEALSENQVVLISGGVSEGDYDYIPEILKKIHFNIEFHKIKVTPGKPVIFARKEQKFCFGLPGNPVSSFVQYEFLVKPFLQKMSGKTMRDINLNIPAGEIIRIKNRNITQLLPARIENNQVYQIEYNGSGHITAFAEASGIMIVPSDKTGFEKGETVHVRPI